MATILEHLQANGESDIYPFHMPGHKRNMSLFHEEQLLKNPYLCDITEIDGFDNLHQPEGIIKNAMERVSRLCHAKKSYFLINGSSCGNLASILAAVPHGGEIIIARNCHKSTYHGAIVNNLSPIYLGFAQFVDKMGITYHFSGSVSPNDVENLLKANKNVSAVMLTSPTYEGIVSDIETISTIVHSYGKVLIVDEAHGAHFGFFEKFPTSATELGADIVIQSVHKTLPAFTQSAVLHFNGDEALEKRLESCLSMVQSSSPSYLLMAGMDTCYDLLEQRGNELFSDYWNRLEQLRIQLKELKNLQLFEPEDSVYDYDKSKIVILCKNLRWNEESPKEGRCTGNEICDILLKNYHLQMEMGAIDYLIAMTSVADRQEGFDRLLLALTELDKMLSKEDTFETMKTDFSENEEKIDSEENDDFPKQKIKMSNCLYMEKESVPIELIEGKISGEFVTVYPPGIPLITPGEQYSEKVVEQIQNALSAGLSVTGLTQVKDDNGADINAAYVLKT